MKKKRILAKPIGAFTCIVKELLKSDLIKYLRNRGALTKVVWRVTKGRMHATTEHARKQQEQRVKK